MKEEIADLDWIFQNGQEVLSKYCNESVRTMLRYMGLKEKGFGRDGSPELWVSLKFKVLYVSYDYLISGDKEGWLNFVGYNNREA